MEQAKELSENSKIGETVTWSTVAGERFSGVLKEWDNGTAIVVMPDGSEKSVRGC